MELKFLGRGSAFNVKEGNTSAFIKNNDVLFLIDCGSNIFERIITNNILDGIKKVYVAITHTHPDHIGSLGDLIFYCYYKLQIKPNIILQTGMIRSVLKSCGVNTNIYNRSYCSSATIPELGLKISRFRTSHVDNLISYGFKLSINNKIIYYSGDCNTFDWAKYNDGDEYYIDCCSTDYPGNVHYYIMNMANDIINIVDKNKIYCMHFDCNWSIQLARDIEFNVVEIYKK